MNRRSWLTKPSEIRYPYLSGSDDKRFSNDLLNLLQLTPKWPTIASRSMHPAHILRVTQDAARTFKARKLKARPLIKDPFLLLSAEWFVRNTGADCLILVRHPAAFVSSIKRLNWRLDTGWLINQEELMQGLLGPHKSDLLRDSSGKTDIIEHACIVWNALNSALRQYIEMHPDWIVIPYEKIARDPVSQFNLLYNAFGIPWTPATASLIQSYSSPDNPGEVEAGSHLQINRNSKKAIEQWRNRLTKKEIARIRELTEDSATFWYSDADW